jgi:cytochrome c biogenesis protein ResB
MLRLLRKLYRRLEARTTAVASVSAVIGLLLVSLLVPQRGDFMPWEFDRLAAERPWIVWADSLRLTDIYHSAPMLGAFGLLLINLFLSFAKRLEHVGAELRVQARPATAEALAASPIYRRVAQPPGAAALERLAAFLARRGYRTHLSGTALRAMKNRFSVLGSSVFHLSFLMLLVALGLRAVSGFHGVIILGEREIFDGRPQSYASTEPRFVAPEDYPDVQFQLLRFLPAYSAQQTVTDTAAVIKLRDRVETVRVNYPLVFGTTIVRFAAYGFAPYLIVRETDKRLEHRAAVRLILTPPGTRDKFAFPDLPVTFTTELYPSYHEQNGEITNTSPELKNPAVILHYTDAGQPQELLVFQGTVKRAGRLEFEFPSVAYWARFEASRDAGRYPMYASFVLAVMGLAWRMLLPRKRIDALVEASPAGPVLHLAGTPDYTREPFATEFGRLVDEFIARQG